MYTAKYLRQPWRALGHTEPRIPGGAIPDPRSLAVYRNGLEDLSGCGRSVGTAPSPLPWRQASDSGDQNIAAASIRCSNSRTRLAAESRPSQPAASRRVPCDAVGYLRVNYVSVSSQAGVDTADLARANVEGKRSELTPIYRFCCRSGSAPKRKIVLQGINRSGSLVLELSAIKPQV